MNTRPIMILGLMVLGCGSSSPIDSVDARPIDTGTEAADTSATADTTEVPDASDGTVDTPEPAKAWGQVLTNVTVHSLGPSSADAVAVAGRAGLESSLGIKPGLFVATASATGLGAEVVAWEHSKATIAAVVGGANPVVAIQGQITGFAPFACIGAPGGSLHFYPPKGCAWGHSITPMAWPGLPRLEAAFDATDAGLVVYFSSGLFKVDALTITGGNGVNVAMDGTLHRSIDDRPGVLGVCRDDKATLIAYLNAASELRVRRLDLSALDVLVASSAGIRADLEGRVGIACDATGQVVAFRPAPGTSIQGKLATAGDVVVVPLVGGKVGAPSWSHLPPPLGKEGVRVVGGAERAVFAVELAGMGDLDGSPVSAGPVATIGATLIADVATTAKPRAIFPASIVGLRLIKGHIVVAGQLETPLTIDGVELKPARSSAAFVLGLRL